MCAAVALVMLGTTSVHARVPAVSSSVAVNVPVAVVVTGGTSFAPTRAARQGVVCAETMGTATAVTPRKTASPANALRHPAMWNPSPMRCLHREGFTEQRARPIADASHPRRRSVDLVALGWSCEHGIVDDLLQRL